MTISLDELEALAKAATPGPWRISIDSHDGAHDVLSDHAGYRWIAGVDDANGCPDGHFIAACDPGTVHKLIAAAKAAKELRALDGAAKSADDFISLRFRLRKALAALESP